MNTEKQTVTTYETRGRGRYEKIRNGLAGIAAVGIALATIHGLGGNEAPKDEIKSYTELAQDSADIPLTPGEKVLVEGIKLDANDSSRNSGSEAVRSNDDVKSFMEENPDEKAAIISSANGLSAAEEYVIVERDIDGDGDGDAIAVPVETEKNSE